MEKNSIIKAVKFTLLYGNLASVTLPGCDKIDAEWESGAPVDVIKAGTSDVLVRKAGQFRVLHIGADSTNNPEAFEELTGVRHIWLLWSYDQSCFVDVALDWGDASRLFKACN